MTESLGTQTPTLADRLLEVIYFGGPGWMSCTSADRLRDAILAMPEMQAIKHRLRDAYGPKAERWVRESMADDGLPQSVIAWVLS